MACSSVANSGPNRSEPPLQTAKMVRPSDNTSKLAHWIASSTGCRSGKLAKQMLGRTPGNIRAIRPLRDGVIADIDFTGKLDLLAIQPGDAGLKIFRNLGSIYFKDITKTSGIPTQITGALKLVMDDWNNDDMLDLFIPRTGESPMFLQKIRGAAHTPTNTLPTLPATTALATGDLNNDLRTDLVCLANGQLQIIFNGLEAGLTLPLAKPAVTAISLVDYDNDGWLDIFAIGDGVQAFRNQGTAGFTDTTAALGLIHGELGLFQRLLRRLFARPAGQADRARQHDLAFGKADRGADCVAQTLGEGRNPVGARFGDQDQAELVA